MPALLSGSSSLFDFLSGCFFLGFFSVRLYLFDCLFSAVFFQESSSEWQQSVPDYQTYRAVIMLQLVKRSHKLIKVAGLLDAEALTRMLPVSMGTDDGVSAGMLQNVQNKLHNIFCFYNI